MRAVHSFMLVTLAIAVALTAVHVAVGMMARHQVAQPVLLLPAPEAPLAEVPKLSAVAGSQWVSQCRAVAERIAAERGTCTADDVWAECPAPDGVDGRLLATAFDRSEWEIVGRRMSARGRNAARQIAVWRKRERVPA